MPGLGFASEIIRSVFSPDGKKLFYLVRKQVSRDFTSGELWSTDLDSGRSEAVLPGIAIDRCFDIAPDGKRVTFETIDADQSTHVWVASLDRRAPPQLVTPSVASKPWFGPGGIIYFLTREGGRVVLHGGIGKGPLSVEFGTQFKSLSPRGDWWLSGSAPVLVHPTQTGPETLVCNFCNAAWGPDGASFYLRFRDIGEMGGGKTIVVGLPAGKELPALPPGGLKSIEDARALKNVVAEIDMSDKVILAPGPSAGVYAYTRVTVQRNLYRIPVR